MLVFRIVGAAVTTAVLAIVLRERKPELAFLLSFAAGIIIFLLILEQIGAVIEVVQDLAHEADLDIMYFDTVLKIIGIAYIGQFGAEITRDSGESALAAKIELAVKVIILFLAVPVMLSLIEIIIEIIP
ncbi:MAG: stage III sporulation protein AD [Halanaerobiaceae bacterium]